MMPAGKREPRWSGASTSLHRPRCARTRTSWPNRTWVLMRLSRPSRWVTLSRVSQSPIPAGLPSDGASTGRGLDGRCHTVATATCTQAGIVVCANATACTTGPCVTDTARASTRRSCRSERMSNNGRLNVDPGTMSPYQHGEVYVLEDGAETDLD